VLSTQPDRPKMFTASANCRWFL